MKFDRHGTSPYKWWTFKEPIHPKTAQEIFTELTRYGDDPHYRADMFKYDNVFEKKLAQNNFDQLPPVTKAWLSWTLTSHFVTMIEQITGIEGLIPDPHFNGGGFHLHTTGGILKPHLDYTRHKKLGLIRRLNFIVYFNKNYDPSWNGQLELWSPDMSECEVKLDPSYNTGVLFETPNAPHGFSVPWSAPDNITRKSLACYLYTCPAESDFATNHLSTQFLLAKGEETDPETEALRQKRNLGRLNV